VCAVVDVAIIVLGSHYPEGDWYEWALQSWLRRSAFLYLAAYVAASALTFSVKVVLAAGAAALVGQLASFAFVLYSAERIDSFRGFTAGKVSDNFVTTGEAPLYAVLDIQSRVLAGKIENCIHVSEKLFCLLRRDFSFCGFGVGGF